MVDDAERDSKLAELQEAEIMALEQKLKIEEILRERVLVVELLKGQVESEKNRLFALKKRKKKEALNFASFDKIRIVVEQIKRTSKELAVLESRMLESEKDLQVARERVSIAVEELRDIQHEKKEIEDEFLSRVIDN